MEPKVSILWINYNSGSFINLALESLLAIKNLDYQNYELIIVDNASTDNSLDIISDFIKKHQIKSKIIRLQKNVGYTGGNNLAYSSRGPQSKYIVLLNSDAVPKKDSVKKLVKIMEDDKFLGAVQGIILDYDEKTIDTAGDHLSELFDTVSRGQGKKVFPSREIYATSPDGAYSVCRVEAIKKAMGTDKKIFDEFIFACYDDYMLGLRLWNAGFKVKVVPFITAKHKRGSSFKKVTLLQFYLGVRNCIALNEMTNSRYKNLLRIFFVRELLVYFLLKMLRAFGLNMQLDPKDAAEIYLRALIDGLKIGKYKRKNGDTLDMYKAPIITINPIIAFLGMIFRKEIKMNYIMKKLNKTF